MKQPKFRGFSNETKSWHYGHGWFEIDYTDEYLKEKGINQQALLYTEGYPVECELASMGQFTGLKDMNNKDIYEGDILADIRYTNVYEPVKYKDGQFTCIDYPDMNLYENLKEMKLQIVGNNYENHNLIW